MSFQTNGLRTTLRIALRAVGLLRLARQFRSDLPEWYRFKRFESKYGKILRHSPTNSSGDKRALLVSGSYEYLEIELSIIKALELAGFIPVVLILEQKNRAKYYSLGGAKEIYFWRDFTQALDLFSEAKAAVDNLLSIEQVLAFEYAGARVGRIAISTMLRNLRAGSINLRSLEARNFLTNQLATSMAHAIASRNVLGDVRPDLTLLPDAVYTRRGELFDGCMAEGTPVIRWHTAHKSNALMLKRYTRANRDQHPISLSPESWQIMSRMRWTDSRREELRLELYSGYANGDWYGESGTQFDKRLVTADEVRRRIGLDPKKKTAFIFPHIAWDASLRWGKDLFRDYEDWLIETVRVACTNDMVNWVIKIHPANVVKQMKEQFQGAPAEMVALRQQISKLPPHIFLLPAESEISTFSLFELMDYCLTVRGTIGIEAASFGIPVLTGGTGRYDHKGFTIDSGSREQYLERVGHIQDIPRLSPVQRELAERFAYGIFLRRPLLLKSVRLQFRKDFGLRNKFMQTRINIKAGEEWSNATDLIAFAKWINDSDSADFLMAAL